VQDDEDSSMGVKGPKGASFWGRAWVYELNAEMLEMGEISDSSEIG
jgi:hypothetical protein